MAVGIAGTLSCDTLHVAHRSPEVVGPEIVHPRSHEPTVESAVSRRSTPARDEMEEAVAVDNASLKRASPANLALQESGRASYYCTSLHGSKTASGEPYDAQELTAAHRTLPFGSRARVTNVKNGKTVVVRINDRGPFRPGRIIDLSSSAAQVLGMLRSGTTEVIVEPLLD